MLSGKAIKISHFLQINRLREGRIILKNGIYLENGSMNVKFIMNVIITYICITKSVKKLQKEYISNSDNLINKAMAQIYQTFYNFFLHKVGL